MKLLLATLMVITSTLTHAEVIMEDIHDYKSGETKVFSLDWDKELELCIKIPEADRNSLKQQCSKRGGCLRLSDKTNNKSYGYTRHIITVNYEKIEGGKLDFTVSNKFDSLQQISVTAFNPNFLINNNFDLSPGNVEEFKVKSEKELAVFADIPVKNVTRLIEACKPKSNCLKVEFYDTNIKSWSWVSSNSGVGKTLKPDANSEIAFRVVNEYPMPVNIRATAADVKPRSCEW